LATPDRAAALSEQLIRAHQALREQLAGLRRELAVGPGGVRGVIPADLLSHCLGCCAAIGTHHAGEDSQLLPALRAAAPGLAPVIDNLIEDHVLVAGLLGQIRELLAAGPEPGLLARELDGLTAILESHFGYEERRIARALDALGPGAWTAEVFALSLPDEASPGSAGAARRSAPPPDGRSRDAR
jgi:hypothetical protein